MTIEAHSEKRRFHRVLYQSNAKLAIAGSYRDCKIIDLSLKGCLLEFAEMWPVAYQALYTLTITLSEELSIVMDVEAVHVSGCQIGFRCLHIDLDSITSLRRLVELNLGDCELLERELSALTS